ncbi:MAG: hypothetical protein Q9194_005286 [Teloschistes cf. exilis]
MPSEYDTWMRRHCDEADDHIASPEEIQALLDYVNGRSTADEAAIKYTETVVKSNEHELVYIWALLHDVAQEFPQTHEDIIRLLKAIQNLPSIEHNGEVMSWKDLPDFHFNLREYSDGSFHFYLPRQDQYPDATRYFINTSAFIARANHLHVIDLGATNGLLSCSEAFETDHGDEKKKQALLLLEATQYLLLSGPEMYQESETDKYAGPLLQGRKEAVAISRWTFWQQRLSDMANDDMMDEDARAVAKQAMNTMVQIAAGAG